MDEMQILQDQAFDGEDEEDLGEDSSEYDTSSDESEPKEYQELTPGIFETAGDEFVAEAPVKFMRGEINYSQFVSLVSKQNQSGPVLPGFPRGQEVLDFTFDDEAGSQFGGSQEDVQDEQESDEDDDDSRDDESSEVGSPDYGKRMKRIRMDESIHAKAYEEELDNARDSKKLRQLAKSKLDPALQGMIGEANLRFARGDRHSVIDICLQVITQATYAPEPYQTLGMVYEELGSKEKSLQFLLIAAHLQRTDVDEWTRLGELALEIEQKEQALTCYGKAYSMDRNNIELGVIYASLLGERMPKKTKLNFYKSLWARKDNRENSNKALLQCSKEMARLHHELGEVETAASVMINAFIEFLRNVIPEDLNFLLELLIALKRFEACVWILTTYYGVGLDVKPEPEVLALTPEDVLVRGVDVKFRALLGRAGVISVPDTYPFDVRAKLVVALVNLDAHRLAESVAFPFTESGPEGVEDLFVDIAEAYMERKCFKSAARWFQMLVSEDVDIMPEVMMNYGECLMQCGEFRKAEEAYKKILEKFPNHVDARLTLSRVLRELGETDEALDFISQDQETGEIDIQLLRQRCMILLEEGRTDDLIPKATLFFSRHFAELQGPEDIHCATLSNKLNRLQRILGTSKYKFSGAGVTKDDEWDLFCRVCSRLHQDKKYAELHRLCLSALGSSIFRPRGQSVSSISYVNITRSSDVVFYAVQSCWHVRNLEVAFPLVRGMVLANSDNSRVIQLLNMFFNQMVPNVRHCRFVLRLLCKLQDLQMPCDAVKLINGNMCMTSGTYKLAIGDYMNVFRRHTEHPFVAFLVGLCFCHLVCQKFTGFKHGFVVQAFTFLQAYRSLRGECQETMYNLGRAYHQLGLTSMALEHYKKALSLPPIVPRSVDPKHSASTDLTAEIAYNIHIIYRHSGNNRLARYYLYKYVQI